MLYVNFKMYDLIGVKEEIINETDDGFEFQTTRKVVATFDKKEDAETYVEASKLSTYENGCTWRRVNKQFCRKSLLRGCIYSEIEEHITETFPHNPKID